MRVNLQYDINVSLPSNNTPPVLCAFSSYGRQFNGPCRSNVILISEDDTGCGRNNDEF